jgi:lipopolysaccharide transport system ATP-binding protein
MNDTVISAENVGKKYRIAAPRRDQDSLRDVLTERVLRPRRPAANQRDGEFWALRDVSFQAARGNALGIIGRYGAGKSTILKILSRITRPTEGRVRLRGKVASLLEVGTGFHGDLTGRENVFLNGAILGMTRRDIVARMDEIVAFADIGEFLDTPIKRYSSGMQVRLAFAVAAHLEPEILVIDEVLAVGDAQFQKKCMGKLQEVEAGGRTVLFVSHNMNAIEQLCTSAMLLDRGRIVEQGTDVRGIIDRYLREDPGASNEAEWRRDSERFDNEWFSPLRLWIGNRSGEPLSMPVSNSDEAWVHIQGDTARLDDSLTVGYAVFDASGLLLYWSYHTDAGETLAPPLTRGRNHITARIPSRFLNEGTYRIELIGGLHFRQWLFEPGVTAPSVTYQISGGLSDSPLWMQKRPGILAPVLKWETATDDV